ncbi:MAG: fibronectin type III domain-containing protein [Planctomycetales bacterium]|nr:fibronectin type III domain-containing protein [Planctomycetales bacterium]
MTRRTVWMVGLALAAGCGGGGGGGGGTPAPPAPTVPGAPPGLVGIPGNATIALSWGAVSGANFYNVYYDDDAAYPPWDPTPNATEGAPPINNPTNTLTLTGLTNGTTYYCAVTAVNSIGESSLSTVILATPDVPPPAPTGVSATAGSASIQVTWSAVTGAASYNVYYDDDASTPWDPSPFAAQGGPPVQGITGTSYLLTGLTPGTAYTLAVSAVKPIGEGALSSTVTATPTGTADDTYEQNDSFSTAAFLSSGTYTSLQCNDDDYYQISLAAGDGMQVTINFTNASGNLDLAVLDPSQATVGTSVSTTANSESVTFNNSVTGNYRVRVYQGTAGVANSYSMTIIRFRSDEGWESNSIFGSIPGWTSGGSTAWTITSADKNTGTYSAQSGAIADSQTSFLELTVANPTGTIGFFYKVDSASGDQIRFLIDSVAQTFPGATSGTVPWTWVTFSVTTSGAHTYRWEYVKDASGSAGLDRAWVDDIDLPSGLTITEGFESGTMTVPLPWTTGGNVVSSGNPNWTITTLSVMTGTYAVRSGTPTPTNSGVSTNQNSYIQLIQNCRAGNITFAYRVDSEAGWDFLQFSIDGVQQGSWSGAVAWTTATYAVSAGSHTFRWNYFKDTLFDNGADAAWIDDIQIPRQ